MARTGFANVGSLRVVEIIVVWSVSMSSPMVTKTIKRNVCCCTLLCRILVRILELLDVCGAIKQAPNVIQNRIVWTLKHLQTLSFKDGGNMNSAYTVCGSVQWLQLFICKHGRAPFLLVPVNNCSRKKDSVAKEQAVIELFCAFNGVFSVLCRTRRLWRMSANRSSNSGRTTAADQKPKEKAMMVFNFYWAVSLKDPHFPP